MTQDKNCRESKCNSQCGHGILLPKLFWPTVRKKCFSDREKLLKFEAEGQKSSKILRSLEQFIQTVKGKNNILISCEAKRKNEYTEWYTDP